MIQPCFINHGVTCKFNMLIMLFLENKLKYSLILLQLTLMLPMDEGTCNILHRQNCTALHTIAHIWTVVHYVAHICSAKTHFSTSVQLPAVARPCNQMTHGKYVYPAMLHLQEQHNFKALSSN